MFERAIRSWGTFRAGKTRLDGAQVERENLGVGRGRRLGSAEQALLLGISLDQFHFLRRSAGLLQIGQRPDVDGEESHRGTVLRPHIRNRGPIGQAHRGHAGAEVFDELADDAFSAEHLNDAENQIGRVHLRREFSGELHPDHFRQQHIERPAKHDGLRFDSADAPADDAQAVDHHRVAVRSHQRVGNGYRPSAVFAKEHALGQVFQVDLMDNADRRWNRSEIVERLLCPVEQLVPFVVPFEFQFHVLLERIGPTEVVDLHRVVDNQIDRNEWIDLLRIAAETLHCAPHRRQVDHGRYAGEVLQDDAGRLERNFGWGSSLGGPCGDFLDVLFGYLESVAVSQNRFEQDANRVGQ